MSPGSSGEYSIDRSRIPRLHVAGPRRGCRPRSRPGQVRREPDGLRDDVDLMRWDTFHHEFLVARLLRQSVPSGTVLG